MILRFSGCLATRGFPTTSVFPFSFITARSMLKNPTLRQDSKRPFFATAGLRSGATASTTSITTTPLRTKCSALLPATHASSSADPEGTNSPLVLAMWLYFPQARVTAACKRRLISSSSELILRNNRGISAGARLRNPSATACGLSRFLCPTHLLDRVALSPGCGAPTSPNPLHET